VLTAEIFSQWQSPKGLAELDPEQLQQHAQLAAAACKSLAGPRTSPDDAWLAGLLHDIGYWILVQECPTELKQAIDLSREQRLPLFECERQTTGASHAEIGAYLLGLWGLPYPIVEAVALHHTPTMVTSQEYDLLGALAVSHALLPEPGAHGLMLREQAHSGVDAEYLASLNAPFDWQEAEQRVRASVTPKS